MLEDLAEMAPGPELAAFLATVDRSVLNGYEMVELMRARSRQIAHEQAALLADMVEVAHCASGEFDSPAGRMERPDEFASDEIRMALCLTRRPADRMLSLALDLVNRLPAVHEALSRGQLDLARARVFAAETAVLDEPTARQVAGEELDWATNRTTGQIGARLRRKVISVDPDAARRRQERSVARRSVHSGLDEHGTARLAGYRLPADRAAEALARIDAIARAVKQAGDERSMDALRADTFLDLLTGVETAGAAAGGAVELRVSLSTLMGLSNEPGEVAGWGPVIGEIARKIAKQQARGPWRASVYDDSGGLVFHGRVRRRPTRIDEQFVKARDVTCRAPGCRVPASHADLDHTRDFAKGGATIPENLGVMCRHHHGYKHHDGVDVLQIMPGVFVWTSRLGHRYVVPHDPPDLPD
ncbi:HNH endonuclease signature motif containing protein [Phytohabitans rumicis]|uniref:HNH endonuclease signature motif containing protein n=1 Tax=Phytohabitans rumicis TaxID=1076125 RepID=UPI001567A856|nr:HNH endonuclease signature motif containing protein [Phytohabitans rumicis]